MTTSIGSRPIAGAVGTALAWYSPEAYCQLEEAIAAAGMPKTMLCSYAEFVARCGSMVREFEREGIEVEKVPIDVPHMVSWCARWGLEINNAGRARYVGMLALADGDCAELDRGELVDLTRAEH